MPAHGQSIVRAFAVASMAATVECYTGKRPESIAATTPVQVGVGKILSLTENGYALVRP